MANWQHIPSGWQVASLGDILVSLQNGLYKPAEFYGRGQPFVRMYNVDSQSWDLTLDTLARAEVDTQEQRLFGLQEGDVLISRVNSIEMLGKTAWVNHSAQGYVYENMLMRLRFNDKVDSLFIAQQLNTPELRAQVRSCAKKASGQASINSTDVQGLEIVLPPLAEQRRIAAVLARADRLRRLRRYALDLSAGYLQAVFVEVFGEALSGTQGVTAMGDLVTITGGGTPSRDVPAYFTGTIPWLTSKDMKGEFIYDTEEHVTSEAIAKSATKLVPANSILLVVKSKILMRRLPIALAKVPLCHGQDIKSIQCKRGLVPEFLIQIIKRNEHRLLEQARGANTEGLTLPMLEEIPVPQVSLALQERFAAIARRHERLRGQQREALRQAEQLFGALLGRAFRGELGEAAGASAEMAQLDLQV